MLIKNGFLIDPASDREEKTDIRIENGLFSAIADKLSPLPGEEILDAAGLTVSPGLIDTHVHFRDPGFTYKEDVHTGALSAAAGGFTSVICMANTSPVVDSLETFTALSAREAAEAVRIYQTASVSHGLKGQEMTDMEALSSAGAAGFTDDGIPLKNADFLYRAMLRAKALGKPISLHEEDPSFIRENGINHGKVSDVLGIYGSPAVAEESLVARDCFLALKTGAKVVIQHISAAGSVDLVRTFRKKGADLHAEVTPHHFSLTEDAVLTHGALAKMNPPLRTEADRQAILEGLFDGTLDLIATDHAPHSAEEKARPLTAAPSGIIGLETSLALGITSLVRKKVLSLSELLRKMTVNPAKLYGLPCGQIRPGTPADLVLFDPNEPWIPKTYRSKSANSPFTGQTLYGKVHYTICGGKIVYFSPQQPQT